VKQKPKIVVILGVTASGKSSLAVEIVKKLSAQGGLVSGWNGAEIISADSRQVYIGLDIGTGKIKEEEKEGIPHYLIDVADPKDEFNVTQFKELAEEKIDEILSKGKLPIIVGGSGFYIQTIVDGLVLPEVSPNKKLRAELENKSLEELEKILTNLEPQINAMIYHSNKRRIIRAIEIIKTLGNIPELKKEPKYNVLQIGLDMSDDLLKSNIYKRLMQRINEGMVEEGKIVEGKIGFERMIKLGLEYKYLALFLQSKITKEDMVKELNKAIWQYAKSQRKWFGRDKRIKWFEPNENKKIFDLIEKFL
jgi:tRNA dimethylallyltransferase